MAGYGMSDPKAAAAINALAAKNNTANASIGYKPTTYQPGELAKMLMVKNGASYMPASNPTAQTSSTSVWNQSAGNNDAKNAMLAWGSAFMQPGAQLTGSVQNQFTAQNRGLDTSTGSTWRAYQPGGIFGSLFGGSSGSSGSGSSGGSSALSGLSSIASGGGLSSLGSMFGGGSSGGLGSMLGGGGMSGIGNALGGALGGGSGAPQAPAEEEKEKDKPIPQRHWAGGYTSEQQAAMNTAKSDVERARIKRDFDQANIESFKGMQGYDDVKKDRVKEAQQLAERQGGQYDTEGNYYSRDAAKDAIDADSKKRAQADANYYDVPDGAVPIAGNEGDKTPVGSTPAAGGGSKSSDKGSGGGLDNDWLKKLAGIAGSWFGGR